VNARCFTTEGGGVLLLSTSSLGFSAVEQSSFEVLLLYCLRTLLIIQRMETNIHRNTIDSSTACTYSLKNHASRSFGNVLSTVERGTTK